jgi:hypothetical protein
MNLKEFNVATVKMERRGQPAIGINSKTGVFNFNGFAAKLIGLDAGDQVQFLQDESEPENWYVEKVKVSGFEVRFEPRWGNGVIFNSTNMARTLIKGMAGRINISARILIAAESTDTGKRTLWGLLLKSDE